MKFYDNIFASAYKAYDKYDEYNNLPMLKASLLIGVHIFGIVAVLLAIVEKLFFLYFTNISNEYIRYVFGCAFIFLGFIVYVLSVRYYSKDRADIILEKFGLYDKREKILWGFTTIISLIAEYTVVAFLLAK